MILQPGSDERSEWDPPRRSRGDDEIAMSFKKDILHQATILLKNSVNTGKTTSCLELLDLLAFSNPHSRILIYLECVIFVSWLLIESYT